MQKFLTTVEAAAYLHLKPSTLVRWRRHEHRGPAVVRLSVNRAVYSVEELNRFVASLTQTFEARQSSEEQPTTETAHP